MRVKFNQPSSNNLSVVKMKVEQQTLDTVLNPYVPNCRYLIEAEVEYPIAQGKFLIPKSFYTSEGTGHFNAVELILCYNQLGYVLFADAFQKGQIAGLGKLELGEFKKLQLQNVLIVGMDDIRFRRVIDPTQPFTGLIRVNQIVPKKQNTLYFAKTEYDFENGKQTGTIDVVLIKL